MYLGFFIVLLTGGVIGCVIGSLLTEILNAKLKGRKADGKDRDR